MNSVGSFSPFSKCAGNGVGEFRLLQFPPWRPGAVRSILWTLFYHLMPMLIHPFLLSKGWVRQWLVHFRIMPFCIREWKSQNPRKQDLKVSQTISASKQCQLLEVCDGCYSVLFLKNFSAWDSHPQFALTAQLNFFLGCNANLSCCTCFLSNACHKPWSR